MTTGYALTTLQSMRAKIPPKISSLGSGRFVALDRDGALKGLDYAVLSP